MSLTPAQRNWKLAKADISSGLRAWESWYLLGISDIRLRYKRSRFGQLWITLSMAIFIGGIGFVYAKLFKREIGTFLPFLAVNYVVWSLVSGLITDSATAFTQASVYMTQEALPKSIFAMRIVVRNLVLFAHNIVIIPVLYALISLYFTIWPTVGFKSPWPGPEVFLAIPGLALTIIAAFLVVLLLGIICTRFRDMVQILQNVVQMAFFMTPVMWEAKDIGNIWIVVFNPFYSFLAIVADPIRGQLPQRAAYIGAITVIVILTAVTLPLFSRCRARIVYWL